MNKIARVIRSLVRSRGFDMIHYSPWENLFKQAAIDLILDVGANSGQSYESFRWAGVDFMNGLGFCLCRAEKNSYNVGMGMDTALDVVFARRELVAKAQS